LITLTERDRTLLTTLQDFGLMTTSQIERKVFGGIRRTTVLRRLRKLEWRGLIARTSGLEKGASAWWITAKGGSIVGNLQGYGHVNRHTLEHDVLISEVRVILESIGASQAWTSGHLLKRQMDPRESETRILPDGIILMPMRDGSKAIALELEMTAKAKGRYVHVLEEYAEKKSVSAVWYIVSHAALAKGVMKAAASQTYSGRKSEWVFWTPLQEILKDPLKIQLRSQTKAYPLKSLVPSIRAAPLSKYQPPFSSSAPAQGDAQAMSRGEITPQIANASNSSNPKLSSSDLPTP
jgi:DNA-binding HxlR family transcriptional regulator